MPNPRKPTHLKALQGTVQKCRVLADEAQPTGKTPVPPQHLDEGEAAKFRVLVGYILGMGVGSVEDTDALANLAACLVEIEEDQVLLRSLGSAYYVPNPDNGLIRPHPAVARLNANRKRAQSLLGEFGLTPASRAKVSGGKKEEANPFEALG